MHWSVSDCIRSFTWLFLTLSCPFPPLSFPCLPSLPGQSSPKPKGGPQKVGNLICQGGSREGGQWFQVRDRGGRGGYPQEWLDKQVTDHVVSFSHFLFFQQGKMSQAGEFPLDAEQCRPGGRDDAKKIYLFSSCFCELISSVLCCIADAS